MEPLTPIDAVADIEPARGFTLVELIVVLAIMIVITTITLTSQTSYNRSLLVTSTAYTIALSIREAQSLGLSSRKFDATQNAGYGVYFHDTLPTKYSVFADVLKTVPYSACPTGVAGTPTEKPGNCVYDGPSEVLTTFNLNKGFRIHDFCGFSETHDARICGSDSGWTAFNILFLRPNTDAIMTAIDTSGNRTSLKCAVIWVAPPGNTTNMKCIVVSSVGQVSVPQTCPATTLTACP